MHGTTSKGEKILIAIGVSEIAVRLAIFISGLIVGSRSIFGIVTMFLIAALMVAVYLGKRWAMAIFIAVAALNIVSEVVSLVLRFQITKSIGVVSILLIAARFVMITLLLANSSVREFLESQRGAE